MATRKNKEEVKLKKDGTPRRKPGPKKGWKQASAGEKRRGRPPKNDGVARRPGRPRKNSDPVMAEAVTVGHFARQDAEFKAMLAQFVGPHFVFVNESKPPFAPPDWTTKIEACAPEGLDLPGIAAWVRDTLHTGDVRTYSAHIAHHTFEFTLNEKGERIPRPGVVLKTIKTTPPQGGSVSPVLDADAVQREAIINSESQTGVPALR